MVMQARRSFLLFRLQEVFKGCGKRALGFCDGRSATGLQSSLLAKADVRSKVFGAGGRVIRYAVVGEPIDFQITLYEKETGEESKGIAISTTNHCQVVVSIGKFAGNVQIQHCEQHISFEDGFASVQFACEHVKDKILKPGQLSWQLKMCGGAITVQEGEQRDGRVSGIAVLRRTQLQFISQPPEIWHESKSISGKRLMEFRISLPPEVACMGYFTEETHQQQQNERWSLTCGFYRDNGPFLISLLGRDDVRKFPEESACMSSLVCFSGKIIDYDKNEFKLGVLIPPKKYHEFHRHFNFGEGLWISISENATRSAQMLLSKEIIPMIISNRPFIIEDEEKPTRKPFNVPEDAKGPTHCSTRISLSKGCCDNEGTRKTWGVAECFAWCCCGASALIFLYLGLQLLRLFWELDMQGKITHVIILALICIWARPRSQFF
uniref:Uncharacterized protein n=1 Tax=Heterosigma akashiwo TaxID=2829 RepID=A0A7S3XWQ8_HETAK